MHESSVDLMRAVNLMLLMDGKYLREKREYSAVAYGRDEQLVHTCVNMLDSLFVGLEFGVVLAVEFILG
jgi:hypothetical protein